MTNELGPQETDLVQFTVTKSEIDLLDRLVTQQIDELNRIIQTKQGGLDKENYRLNVEFWIAFRLKVATAQGSYKQPRRDYDASRRMMEDMLRRMREGRDTSHFKFRW